MTDIPSLSDDELRRAPLFVVINAGSGDQDAQARIDTLREVFTAAGREHHILPVEQPSQLPQQAAAAVQQARAQRGVVVAAGGDGTLNAVAQAVIGSGCVFGVIPQGTFNYFGRTHGISQDTAQAARALLRARIEPVQVGQVNGQVFLVNASLGLYPQLLEDREVFKQKLGRSRVVALVSGLATLMRPLRQLDLHIESAGRTQQLRTPTLFVGNNDLQFERVGLARAVAALEHGQLAAIAMQPIGTLALLGLALRGALGHLGEAHKLTGFAFHRLRVQPRGLRRIKVATDGEIRWMTTPLVFEVAPQPLPLLVPVEADRVDAA